jgi:hypothetical protein
MIVFNAVLPLPFCIDHRLKDSVQMKRRTVMVVEGLASRIPLPEDFFPRDGGDRRSGIIRLALSAIIIRAHN